MEAKDTVLDTVKIYHETGVDITKSESWDRIRPVLERQAEVSFVAGRQAERQELIKLVREFLVGLEQKYGLPMFNQVALDEAFDGWVKNWRSS